jgi:ubiquinone/menaquinone biosynthesis C-methylase UbiE
MNRKEHWENVYSTKAVDQVSWYREHLENSLKLILDTGVVKDAAIIDVGGGRSTLIDDLIDNGYVDISVLDMSSKAIEDSRERLADRSDQVEWIVADITTAELPAGRYDIWHDRAVFHFLTDTDDRRKYVDLMMRSVKQGGNIIIASFGKDGPNKCSGLEVVRYDPSSMRAEFGDDVELVECLRELHETPFATVQDFIYCRFKRK